MTAPPTEGEFRATFRIFHSGNIVLGDEAYLHVIVQIDKGHDDEKSTTKAI